MGAAHENWSRVWMDHWDGKNLDWPPYGATLPPGQLNLTVAQKWDAIVAAAEEAGIHFQMTLQHHGQYSTMVDANWAENPYDLTNNIGSTNGFMTDPVEFFTNATAIAIDRTQVALCGGALGLFDFHHGVGTFQRGAIHRCRTDRPMGHD